MWPTKKAIFEHCKIVKIKACKNENEEVYYRGIPARTTVAVDLPLYWVKQNFEEGFTNNLMKEMSRDKFFVVPKGASKNHDWHENFDEDAPSVQYM